MKETHQTAPADPAGLEMEIGYSFRDQGLLLKALTHSSFCNESDEVVSDNERLEFLGDAIISTVIAESAFRQFPEAREGELTRLKSVVVAEPGLAMVARRIDLGKYLRLGHGAATADQASTHPGVLCDAFEALIGAVYLDAGFETAKELILRLLAGELASAKADGRQIDSKSELQMLTYSTARKPPVYSVTDMQGPPHSPVFSVSVTLPDGTVFCGSGRSKKEAQQDAAAAALAAIRPTRIVSENNHEDSTRRD